MPGGRSDETASPGPAEVSASIALTGNGLAPTMTLSPTSLSFGSITQGSQKVLSVKVSNTWRSSLQFWPDSRTVGNVQMNGTVAGGYNEVPLVPAEVLLDVPASGTGT